MRYVLAALLTAIPLALGGWVLWRGRQPAPWDVAAAATAKGAQGEDEALLALFREDFAVAKVKGEVVLYDQKKLFDYIDGAAPIFIERQFRRLAAAEMATPEGSDLTCDVYDMRSKANAESIFDKERSPMAKPVQAWASAIAGPMSFVFQTGRYYVKLTAFDAKAEAALPALAKALHARMQ